ncbi:CinA family protein [Xenophilus sp. Marseille-Q4582]|uniref:CinA family protein n=1 Tax=Xenophilus sp. Marseille-Q4582 TaxID=2866600 RepID=UPI001CE48F89|nr:CinA family protein [Xenophilus sp. Marseille-Q4582]
MSAGPQDPETPGSAHERAADYLRAHDLVVVTAESCTAGLIAARLASVPHAGQVLESAFVVYDPKAKMRCLGVPAEVLARHNLTSEAVVLAMAQGALAHSDANVAIANTGVADDSDPAIPPGTQCYAWAFRDAEGRTQAYTATHRFSGERNTIREASADHALHCLPHYHRLWRQAPASSPATAPAAEGGVATPIQEANP